MLLPKSNQANESTSSIFFSMPALTSVSTKSESLKKKQQKSEHCQVKIYAEFEKI